MCDDSKYNSCTTTTSINTLLYDVSAPEFPMATSPRLRTAMFQTRLPGRTLSTSSHEVFIRAVIDTCCCRDVIQCARKWSKHHFAR